MLPKSLLHRRLLSSALLALSLVAANAVAAEPQPSHSGLTAAEIVDKHVAARGGLQAWRALQTLTLSGKLEAGHGSNDQRRLAMASQRGAATKMQAATQGAAEPATKADADPQVLLPITLEMKRPNKSRIEIEFAGKTAVQGFDGVQGWKLRPYLNRTDVEPFTPDEAKSEATKADLDGPLVDYAAKGTKVALAGVEPVAGHDAYKLTLTLKNGDVQHIWIDTKSFLDVKVEGIKRRMDGRMHDVYVYQRDFRSVQGLMVPFILETAVDGYKETHKLIVEKVAVNPKLDDSRFAKPGA